MRNVAALTLAGCLAVGAGSAAATPKQVKITYAASMNGMAIGAITEHFDVDGASYRIVSETKPQGLAVFMQRQPLRVTSRGQVAADGLRPALFEARRNPADPPQVSAEFDWPQSQLTLKHEGRVETLPLTAGTQDRLSIMYQFMFVKLDRARAVEFGMTNGRKVDQYRYRITPDVELDTPVGRLKTLHLVKERDPGDSSAEVWVSPRHYNLPVKVVIVEKNGMRFEQIAQSLEVRD